MQVAPTRRAAADVPLDRWDDPARGRIAWRTLLSAGLTPSDKLVCGVAELAPGDWLAPHRHPEAELYFGLEGRARVTVEGVVHDLDPGVALFIPGGATHAAEAPDGPARYLYVFAADRFEDVAYDFAPPDAAPPDAAPQDAALQDAALQDAAPPAAAAPDAEPRDAGPHHPAPGADHGA